VWADAFGSEKLKNIWITILLLSSPMGVFLGFMTTSIVAHEKSFGWEWSFYIQTALMVPCCMCIFYVDGNLLDINQANKFRQKCL
jgi:low affinity Fe/Cu permease